MTPTDPRHDPRHDHGAAEPPAITSPAARLDDLHVDLPHRTTPYGPGRTALAGLTLTAPRGQVTALVGANGAGKTTALRCLIGALAPHSGRIELLGTAMGEAEQARPEGVALVGDSPGYPERWSARRIGRLHEAAGPFDTAAFLSRLRADDVPTAPGFGELSRGQRMQLALQAALASGPELLLLDEPLAALDPLARERMLARMRELMAHEGRSLLLATHDLEGMDRFVDHLVVIGEGRTLLEGDLETLAEDHLRVELDRLAFEAIGRGAGWIGPEIDGSRVRSLIRVEDAAGLPPAARLARPTLRELAGHVLRAHEAETSGKETP